MNRPPLYRQLPNCVVKQLEGKFGGFAMQERYGLMSDEELTECVKVALNKLYDELDEMSKFIQDYDIGSINQQHNEKT